MQPYNITPHEELPLSTVTFSEDYIVAEHNDILMQELISFLDKHSEPTFLIFDLQNVSMNVEDITIGANRATDGALAFLKHDNLAGTVLISKSAFVELAAKGLSMPAFGNQEIDVVRTHEDAITFVQQRNQASN